MICNYQLKVNINIKMTHNNIESRCKHPIMENLPIMIFVIFSCIFKVIVMEDKLINTRSSKYSLQTTNTANINMIRHSVCEKINF